MARHSRRRGARIASLSPELFLRRDGPRACDRADQGHGPAPRDGVGRGSALAALRALGEERAENVMIVDLMRNDLGRVCEPGSVAVPRLPDAEPHPGVWHLVSRRSAAARSGAASDGELLRATFPPGSVTGAPKVRAMRVIAELEAPRARSTPARSATPARSRASSSTSRSAPSSSRPAASGSAPAAASSPTPTTRPNTPSASPRPSRCSPRSVPGWTPKPRGTAPAADLAPRPTAGVFTSLVVTDGRTRGLAAHLDRLAASVARLYAKDLPGSLPADLARCLAGRPTGRLRITVRPVGGPLQATVEVVPLTPPPDAVTLRPVTVSGGIGAHKYRDRRLLAALTRQACLAPGEQLLLTDDTGELLETDRANLFAVADGVLLTPPADGRLLPGTTRAAIIQAAHDSGIKVGFKPLTLDQLQAASEVFVTNAVAGVLPVTAVLPVTGRRSSVTAVLPRAPPILPVTAEPAAADHHRLLLVAAVRTTLPARGSTRLGRRLPAMSWPRPGGPPSGRHPRRPPPRPAVRPAGTNGPASHAPVAAVTAANQRCGPQPRIYWRCGPHRQ